MDRGPLSITITPTSIVYAVVVLVGAWLIFFLRDLVLIVLTAIVISSALEPGIMWLVRRLVPRILAVSGMYIAIIGSLFTFAYIFFPPLLAELNAFILSAPQLVDAFNVKELVSNELLSTATQSVAAAPSISETLFRLQDVFTSTSEGAIRALSAVFGGVFSFALILLLSIYFSFQETGIDDFLRIVTPVNYQQYVLSLWRRSHAKIGLWMQGQLVLSLIVGVLTYLWLTILGVPYALVLAVFAALAELVPVFGSIAAAVPSVAVAFSAGGPTLALLAAGGYLVINQLQANLIYPLVVKKVVGVPPLLVILALIAGGQLAGFLGILLSVPVAAALQEFISDIEKSKLAAAKEHA